MESPTHLYTPLDLLSQRGIGTRVGQRHSERKEQETYEILDEVSHWYASQVHTSAVHLPILWTLHMKFALIVIDYRP